MAADSLSKQKGLFVGLGIMLLWFASLAFLLNRPVDWYSPFTYLFVLLHAHLYPGLFITAHDAMHGTVSPGNPRLNHAIGRVCAALFAFNFYGNLLKKHHAHHRHVATDQDPDYHPGGFWPWYLKFARQYVNVWQILLMAVAYNVLYRFFFPKENVILYWIVPSLLATFQLFYFGTYLPHRGMHHDASEHKSRSQAKNHVWAFVACYFFGYHYEHHASPGTPWWKLHKAKEATASGGKA